MFKQYLGIFALVTLGAVAGGLYTSGKLTTDEGLQTNSPLSTSSGPSTSSGLPAADDEDGVTALVDAAGLSGERSSAERLASLEAEIQTLRARIAVLEAPPEEEPPYPTYNEDTSQTQLLAEADNAQAPIINGLVAAGINPVTAEEIARRQSEAQLRRLELRDTAIREGYMGSGRYRDELRELMDEEYSVQDQVDESVYDRYLYHTGQSNRIVVNSVMMGSAAESSGIRGGDQIVRYEDQRMYNFNDLRSATTQGDRDELVAVTVVRNGNEVTMSIPRGPLGINMNSIRVDPDS